jgi:polar amino acid transport system substrate-binding protein
LRDVHRRKKRGKLHYRDGESQAKEEIMSLRRLKRATTSLSMVALSMLVVVAPARAEELVIAFTPDTPPYVMDEGQTGIEIEIVRVALAPKGYTFTVRQMPYGELADAVKEQGVDAAATVTEMNNGTFYSDEYITFHNAAFTKKSAHLTIDSIEDLKGQTVLAWENAYEDLGPKFEALFSPDVKAPYREKYHEIANQRDQVEEFWKADADVIVIGEAVMKWFSKELADVVDTKSPLVIHEIFPKKTKFRISFESAKVRDDFNAGLKALRASGEYDKIYAKYLK